MKVHCPLTIKVIHVFFLLQKHKQAVFLSQNKTLLMKIMTKNYYKHLCFSLQQWSGQPRHGVWWHGRTHQASWLSRRYCPRTQYQPESRLHSSDRPEDHQNHPETQRGKSDLHNLLELGKQKGMVENQERFTMQDEAPEAPAQIIRSVMLVPQ